MDTTQAAYTAARAAYLAIVDTLNAHFDPFRDTPADVPEMPAAEFDALCDAHDAQAELLGLYPARAALQAAEVDLVTWARATIEQHPLCAPHRAQLAPLWQAFDAGTIRPVMRAKLLDLCLKFRP